MPIMKLLVFIFHNGNRAHSAQIGRNLLKLACIVIGVVSGGAMGEGLGDLSPFQCVQIQWGNFRVGGKGPLSRF